MAGQYVCCNKLNKYMKNRNKKIKRKQKALFDMVYQWGRVGVMTNAKCPAFQDTLKELITLSDKEEDIRQEMLDEVMDKTDEKALEKSSFKPPVSDQTIIKECLDYASHRIRKHPDSGMNKKHLERIDELRKGEDRTTEVKGRITDKEAKSFGDFISYLIKDKQQEPKDTFCGMPVPDNFYVEPKNIEQDREIKEMLGDLLDDIIKVTEVLEEDNV